MNAAIRVENLRFGYDGAEVLHGLSFDVQRGQVTGLLGPNGAGKSTTLKILTGILKFSEGRVEVEGCPLPDQAFEVKKRIGYVPESADLYESISALEFLELCGRLHEIEEKTLQSRIDALLEGFGLSGQRRQRLGSYSKGMRQKILISAALLHYPPVIVLDEPLTGLDVESAMMTKDLLASLAAAGKSVLYSSHVLDVVERFCNKVLIIDHGDLVAQGSPEELKTNARESSLEAVPGRDSFRKRRAARFENHRVVKIVKRIINHPAVARLLRGIGVDPPQYSLLLDLFKKLSDRQEYEMGGAQMSGKVLLGLVAVLSAIINLVAAFAGAPIRTYVLVNFAVTGIFLLMALISEATNTFLNPVEASILAHQPVRDGTYFAAKLTYLAAVVAAIVFPLNAVPSLAGVVLKDARWFYPLTYLTALYLFGSFVALLSCALLGLLFRVVPISRLRGIASSLQIGVFLLLFIAPRLVGLVRPYLPALNPAYVSAIPPVWFVSLALIGHGQSSLTLGWLAVPSMILSGVFIAFGVRSLSKGYMTQVHLLLRSGPARSRSSRGWLGNAVRMMTGKPSGRAAFQFINSMARSDWQFRRTVIPLLIQLLLLPLIGIVRGLGASPFNPGSPTAIHFLPHISGVAGLSICTMLTYSDQYRGAWIFLTAPLDGIRSFVRGIYWALWIPVSIVPLLLLPLCVWYWGIADALLFVGYCVALGSFYLSVELFLVDGLPFANPPRPGGGMMAAPLVIAALVGALVIVGLQWLFIFQSRLVTLSAALVFAGAAYVTSRASLRNLETNVLHNLHVIASGSAAMFKELN